MSLVGTSIRLRFEALAPELSEQILSQLPDIIEWMGKEEWARSIRIWEGHKISIINLYFSCLITDKEKTKLIARLNKQIVRERKNAIRRKGRTA